MGYNYDGQLGNGTYSLDEPYGTNRPQQIVASSVTAVAGGALHSLFLKSDGSLWAMGANYAGQLGTARPATPVAEQIVGDTGPIRISIELLSGGDVRLSVTGTAGKKYALDRSFSLTSADWRGLATNTLT